jgi:hypothetical protein
MIRLFAPAFLLLTPLWALAEIVPVIAGEHADFTRVVLTIPQGSEWGTANTNGVFSVVLPPTTSFDINGVFDKIPRTRIAAIQINKDNNHLEIELSCSCAGNAYLYRDVYLVIDFKESRNRNTLRAPTMNTHQKLVTQSQLPPWWNDAFTPETSPNILGNSPEVVPMQHEMPVQIFERITKDIATAVTNGRIEIDRMNIDGFNTTAPIGDNQTARQVIPAIGLGSQEIPPPNKPSNENFDVCETYGSSKMFSYIPTALPYRDISQLRQALFSEAGRIDESAFIQLAIAHLEIGMATEARHLLINLPNSTPEIELLTRISQIIDQKSIAKDDIRQYRHCTNSLYLWYFLSAESEPLDTTDSKNILLQFKSISTWLQHTIFLQLYDKLQIGGEISAAEEIAAYVNISQANEGHQEISPQTYVFEDSDFAIYHAIYAANRDRPDLLGSILSSPRNSGGIDDLVSLSKAIRFEHQETPIWIDVLGAEILISLSVKNYAAAIFGLEELAADEQGSEKNVGLSNNIILTMSADASDVDFLAAYFQMDQSVWHARTIETVNARLTSLKLPGIPKAPSDASTAQPKEEQLRLDDHISLSAVPTNETRVILSRENVRLALNEAQLLKAEILELTE